jgi:hypothetical protein
MPSCLKCIRELKIWIKISVNILQFAEERAYAVGESSFLFSFCMVYFCFGRELHS